MSIQHGIDFKTASAGALVGRPLRKMLPDGIDGPGRERICLRPMKSGKAAERTGGAWGGCGRLLEVARVRGELQKLVVTRRRTCPQRVENLNPLGLGPETKSTVEI